MKMGIQISVIAYMLFFLGGCTKQANSPSNAENAINVEQQLLVIVNEHRTENGLNPLAYSDLAYQLANDHNDYMIASGSINHDNFTERASEISQATNASSVSENVATGYTTAAMAFAGWLSSGTHREAIEGEFTHTAISVKMNTAGNLYFTQLFYR